MNASFTRLPAFTMHSLPPQLPTTTAHMQHSEISAAPPTNYCKRSRFALALLLAAAATGALQADPVRTPVTDIKPLLMRAAAQGLAQGVLTGVGPAYLQRRFDTNQPVEIDVQRIQALAQPGCARLKVTTRQRGVLINGHRDAQELVYQLNYCVDGRFPEDR